MRKEFGKQRETLKVLPWERAQPPARAQCRTGYVIHRPRAKCKRGST